ncbi:MAG: addiction module protein [Phycisphaerales bacterium]
MINADAHMRISVYMPPRLGHTQYSVNQGMPMSLSLPTFDLTGLSETERLLLAAELLELHHAPAVSLSAEQLAEMERRDSDADAGRVTGESWEIVRDRLKPHG